MNPLFINTRPKPHAIDLDIPTVCLPLLEICPLEVDQGLMRAFVHGQFSLVVVVSVAAARYALQELGKLGVSSADDLPCVPTMVAVGSATKCVLEAFGFGVLMPNEPSNEGMLCMPVIDELQMGDRTLFWRGVGGRTLLSEELANRGVEVQSIAFYERRIPDDLVPSFARLRGVLAEHSPVFVLISSQMSLDAWRGLSDDVPNAVYLPLGTRLAQLVKDAYPNHPQVPLPNLETSTLIRALGTYLTSQK